MTMLLDQHDRAGNLAGCNFVAEELADPLQFRARKARPRGG
ncbi:MAG: hypothetical protein WCA28_17225 [Bradyrhizobium sp.]